MNDEEDETETHCKGRRKQIEEAKRKRKRALLVSSRLQEVEDEVRLISLFSLSRSDSLPYGNCLSEAHLISENSSRGQLRRWRTRKGQLADVTTEPEGSSIESLRKREDIK